jgi:hypothetical protein
MKTTLAAVLRAEVDALFADWAWHLDHGEYDEVVELYTADAVFVTGAVSLRGRAEIKNRYTERHGVRSTRHMYSGLRLTLPQTDSGKVIETGVAADGTARPPWLQARSTWVSYAVNGPAPVDDLGAYLVADFEDVLTWCADQRWRISERRIIPVFRDPSRAPV